MYIYILLPPLQNTRGVAYRPTGQVVVNHVNSEAEWEQVGGQLEEAGEKSVAEAEDMGHTYSCLTEPPTDQSRAAAGEKAEESAQENVYAELNQVYKHVDTGFETHWDVLYSKCYYTTMICECMHMQCM